MLSCEVICDLMVLYASDEASAETKQLVEAHLEHCPECLKAFQQTQAAEGTLADLEPVAAPTDGQQFIIRIRRLLFIIGATSLFIFGYGLAVTERVVFQNIFGIPILQTGVLYLGFRWHLASIVALSLVLFWWGGGGRHKAGIATCGESRLQAVLSAALLAFFTFVAYDAISTGYLLATLLFGSLLLGLHMLSLRWREQQRPGSGPSEVSYSLIAAIPMLVLAVSTYNAVSLGGLPGSVLAGVLLLAGLAITLMRLPRLPYLTWITMLVLSLASVILLGRGVFSVADLVKDSFALHHPSEGVTLEETVRVDLQSLDLALVESQEVPQIHGVPLSTTTNAVQAKYAGNGHQTLLTALQFERQEETYEFFSKWIEGVPTELWAVEIPDRLRGRGRIILGYDGVNKLAYSAWHTGNWGIIVEVPGLFNKAMPLSFQIKKLVVDSYNSTEQPQPPVDDASP